MSESEEKLTVFMCGPPKDHKCDAEGPTILGGVRDGQVWTGPDTPLNRRNCTWGSVSCSICGMTAMEKSMWEGP